MPWGTIRFPYLSDDNQEAVKIESNIKDVIVELTWRGSVSLNNLSKWSVCDF